MIYLSPHFTLAEAERSMYAARHGINNRAPRKVIPFLMFVATHVLEPVRRHYGVPFSPSSWYRCPALNKAIGGSRNSDHMTGRAVDFEVPGVPNIELARWIEQNLKYDQLILECVTPDDPSAGWVHVSAFAGVMRQQTLTYSGRQYSKGLPPW